MSEKEKKGGGPFGRTGGLRERVVYLEEWLETRARGERKGGGKDGRRFGFFSLGVNVFPSTKFCMSHSIFSPIFMHLDVFSLLFSFWSLFSPRGASVPTPLLATALVVFDFL